MTPQSCSMIAAPVAAGHEAELRRLLESMNHAPGMCNPRNELIPFGQLPALHFARLVLLEDATLGDIRAYQMPEVNYPTYLCLLADFDGAEAPFLAQLARVAGPGLRRLFLCCSPACPPDGDLLAWLWPRRIPAAANYINWIGRTVRQVGEEQVLHDELARFLREHGSRLAALPPARQHEALRQFVMEERRQRRLTLTPPQPTPLGWRVRNALHLVAMPLLALLLLPVLVVVLPFLLYALRQREQSDPVIAPRVAPVHADQLASLEDSDVTNAFTAMGSLKPGWFRRMLISAALLGVDYSARHIFYRGRLGRVTTIHFARWVYLDRRRRVLFASNYDGSLESYMDDFINKVGFGLNLVFSNGLGYPRTNWLILDGANDEQKFKAYLRRHQLPTQVWYRAHPGLTARDQRRNALIREGLEQRSLSGRKLRAWLQLL
ncbi:MAG: hypothetical protein ACRD01_13865 [Terriglobales bacterium]